MAKIFIGDYLDKREDNALYPSKWDEFMQENCGAQGWYEAWLDPEVTTLHPSFAYYKKDTVFKEIRLASNNFRKLHPEQLNEIELILLMVRVYEATESTTCKRFKS